MSLTREAVECEGAIRAWLRTTAAVGARWYFGAPEQPTFPLGIVKPPVIVPMPGRIVPIDQATVELDLWGGEPRDRYDLAAIATALKTAIDSVPAGTPMGAAAVCTFAGVISGPSWSPDPDDGRARYVLRAEFHLRPA